MFHIKSGVVVLPRLPLLLELNTAPDEVCSLDRLNRSIENTFSWQHANNSWKKSPRDKNNLHYKSLTKNPVTTQNT